MKRVVVVGAGPAGTVVAARLAAGGIREVIVIDEKPPWEKPCGGGLTYKAYRSFPLLEHSAPHKAIRQALLSTDGGHVALLRLDRPIRIYSRAVLNRLLLEKAIESGAEFIQARVTAVEACPSGWRVRTAKLSLDADYCVIATGARNSLRDFGARFRPCDLMYALGYYLEREQQQIDIRFLAGVRGYIWVFPRVDHVAVGICGKGLAAPELRQILHGFLREKGWSWKEGRFYAHPIPALEVDGWRRNRYGGRLWVTVGDAAGLVDPITGEGIYYALWSGQLAAEALLDETVDRESKTTRYEQLLEQAFLPELEFASRIASRVFLGSLLGAPVPQRMIQLIRYSQRFRQIVRDLFAGMQPYSSLKARLLRSLSRTIQEALVSVLFHRVSLEEEQA